MKIRTAVFVAYVIAVAACGARSSLGVPDEPPEASAGGTGGAPRDAGPDVRDAGPDVVDAGPDVVDAPPDVPSAVSCEEAGITYIYVITEENDLYRFYPPDLSFALIGNIKCPGAGGATPFSMAVDRKGRAYVLFNDGRLFDVSTATAACKATKFVSGQGMFNQTFGMGFSANKADPGETLFIAGDGAPEQLGTIETASLLVTTVGPFSSMIGDAELTGTGDARLFAFGVQDPSIVGSHLAEINKTNASILSDTILPVGQNATAWAFAFWGGDFYFFTSTGGGSSDVNRYHPDDGSLKLVKTLNRTIVGAGVSTCAPE